MGAQPVPAGDEGRLLADHCRTSRPTISMAHPDGAVVRVSCTLKEVMPVMQSIPGPAIARAGSGVCYAYFGNSGDAAAFAGETARQYSETVVEFAPENRKEAIDLWPAPGQDLEIMKRIKHHVRSANAIEPWPTLRPYLRSRRQAPPGGSGPVRALRAVPERLPHLSRARPGDGFAARPHLPDGAGGGGRAHQPFVHRAHRAVPGLPRLRERLPFRRAVRPAGGGRARGNRRRQCSAARSAQRMRQLRLRTPAAIAGDS